MSKSHEMCYLGNGLLQVYILSQFTIQIDTEEKIDIHLALMSHGVKPSIIEVYSGVFVFMFHRHASTTPYGGAQHDIDIPIYDRRYSIHTIQYTNILKF